MVGTTAGGEVPTMKKIYLELRTAAVWLEGVFNKASLYFPLVILIT
jgi:hypothetical protein